ncbi:hypothetical protein [Actinocorallia populi]|uniref:hypothetical protein n=1 Tax=Actinocorallia populi TaxID=2079200 RepID=UPI000D08BC62|nr:hypothetical protein [Actinocorallia populi]
MRDADHGPSILLAQAAESLAADPEVRFIRAIGNPDAPVLLVLETSPAHAEVLRRRFGRDLEIEEDQII